ncbi:MFS transporter [Sinomonas sp. P10A9]|uniref:MFS transporter n=1 Tax=Sinomonas puerhi TaxID=3238584 RepID=A0AB39L3G9_9MICC
MVRVLGVRNFAFFWTGQLVSGTGTWMQTVAMAWLVLQISHSPGILGTVTMLQFLPMMLFTLPAGVVADRVPKRGLLIATQSLAALQALVLGILTLLGTPQIWELAVLAVVLGLSNAFNNPTQQAFLPELTGHDLLPDAVAMNSLQFNGTRMIGFALGGIALAELSAAGVFLINAASFAASLAALLLMRPAELHAPAGQRPGHHALREGLTYTRRTPAVVFVLASLAVVGTFGFNWPVAAPLMAQDLLDVGAVGFGALMGAFGAGSLVAGAGLILLGPGGRRRMVTAGAVLALVLIALGISRSYPASLALMAVAGISGTVYTTTANSSLQAIVPDRLRGRVMSLFVLLMAGTTPIGATLLGWGADAFGISATTIAFGAVTAVGLGALLLHHRLASRRAQPPVA